MYKNLVLLAIGAVLCSSGTVNAASFDCAQASNTPEKLVCSDKKISFLDEKLAVIYEARLKASANVAHDRRQQRAWLTSERNACVDIDCLRKAYRSRIIQLWQLDSEIRNDFETDTVVRFEQVPSPRGGTQTRMAVGTKDAYGTPYMLDMPKPDTAYTVRDPQTGAPRFLAMAMEYQGIRGGSMNYYRGTVIASPKGIVKKEYLANGDGATGSAVSVLLPDRLIVAWTVVDNTGQHNIDDSTPVAFNMRAYDFDLSPLGPVKTLFHRSGLRGPLLANATPTGFALVWREVVDGTYQTAIKTFSKDGKELTSSAKKIPTGNRHPTKMKALKSYYDGSLCIQAEASPYAKKEAEPVYVSPNGQASGADWICRWRDHLVKIDQGKDTDASLVFADWSSGFLADDNTAPVTPWLKGKSSMPVVMYSSSGPTAVSPDQRWFVSARPQSQQFLVWDIANGYRQTTVSLKKRLYDEGSLKITADNRYGVLALASEPLQIYSLDGGKLVGEIPVKERYAKHVAISSDKRIITYAGTHLSRVDLTADGYRHKADSLLLRGNPKFLEISRDGSKVALVNHLGFVSLFRFIEHHDIDRVGIDRVNTVQYDGTKQAAAAVWDDDHNLVWVAWRDGTVVGYNGNTLAEKHRVQIGKGRVLRAIASGNHRYLGLTIRIGDGPQAYNNAVLLDLNTRKSVSLVEKMPKFAMAIPANDGQTYYWFSYQQTQIKPVTGKPIVVDGSRPAPRQMARQQKQDDQACVAWLDEYADKLRMDEERAEKFSGLVKMKNAGPNSKQLASLRKHMPACHVKTVVEQMQMRFREKLGQQRQ